MRPGNRGCLRSAEWWNAVPAVPRVATGAAGVVALAGHCDSRGAGRLGDAEEDDPTRISRGAVRGWLGVPDPGALAVSARDTERTRRCASLAPTQRTGRRGDGSSSPSPLVVHFTTSAPPMTAGEAPLSDR